jgi:hypothetical protein
LYHSYSRVCLIVNVSASNFVKEHFFMKVLKRQAPVKLLFLLVFTLMVIYQIITRIPFFPEEIYGFGFQKMVKIFIGLLFSLGSLIIYTRQKRANHGSGR